MKHQPEHQQPWHRLSYPLIFWFLYIDFRGLVIHSYAQNWTLQRYPTLPPMPLWRGNFGKVIIWIQTGVKKFWCGIHKILAFSDFINRKIKYHQIHSSDSGRSKTTLKTVRIHIAKTLGSTSISHRPDTFASNRCLMDVNSRVFIIWGPTLIKTIKSYPIDDRYISIGSGNGLSPVRRQAVTWANADPVAPTHICGTRKRWVQVKNSV